jgi:pimeloyl-ACP methyl ester carboxylesterase
MGTATVELARILCPVALVTGDASEPFYASIADVAAGSIPEARRIRLPGLAHDAPITRPGALAELIRETLTGAAGSLSAQQSGDP